MRKAIQIEKIICVRHVISFFSTKGNLVEHEKIHMNEKDYKCSYLGCTRSFTRKSSLIDHERIHTGEKPYKCDYEACSYSSCSLSGLISHKKTHIGERP
jgi:uncharacterized Zn-finger protein